MDNRECFKRLQELHNMMGDFLDMMEIEEADEKSEKDKKKETEK